MEDDIKDKFFYEYSNNPSPTSRTSSSTNTLTTPPCFRRSNPSSTSSPTLTTPPPAAAMVVVAGVVDDGGKGGCGDGRRRAVVVGVKCILVEGNSNCTFSLLPSYLHGVYASPAGDGWIVLQCQKDMQKAYACPFASLVGLSLILDQMDRSRQNYHHRQILNRTVP
jgi:hypothetical protein